MIAQIEDAILTSFSTVNDGQLGYKFASIATYGGEFDEDITQVIRRLPGIWVVYAGGGKPVAYGTSKVKWRMPATFAVLVAARSVRGEGFTRHGLKSAAGAVLEVGAYQLLEDARLVLLNQDLGLDIERFTPGAVKTLYNTRINGMAMSVFSQEWHTSFMVAPPTAAQDDWLRMGMNYYLQPDNGVADAVDLVTLT